MKTNSFTFNSSRHVLVYLCLVVWVWGLATPSQATTQRAKSLVGEGNVLYQTKDFQGAKAKYLEATKEDKNCAPAYSNLGLTCARLGEFADANEHALEATTLEPANWMHTLNLGKVYAMQSLYARAIGVFTNCLTADPNRVKALYNRGWCYDEMGDYEKAVLDYARVIGLDPSHHEAKIAIAITRARQQQEGEAAWWLKKVIRDTAKDPKSSTVNALARRNLRTLRGHDYPFANQASPEAFQAALSKLVHDRTGQAAAAFKHLTEQEPNSPICHEMLALASIEANTYDPNDPQDPYKRALALLAQVQFTSTPEGQPLYVDLASLGLTPAALPLFPGTHEVVLKSLPCIYSYEAQVAQDDPNVFELGANPEDCLDISGLVLGESTEGWVANHEYQIRLSDVMHLLALCEFDTLSAAELSDSRFAIEKATGFYGGEGDPISATLSCLDKDILISREHASSSAGDEYFAFQLGEALPGYRQITLHLAWISPYDTGSFVLNLLPRNASLLVSEDFESKDVTTLGPTWTFETGTGSVQAAEAEGAPQGSGRSLILTGGQSATVHVDLTGCSKATLDFQAYAGAVLLPYGAVADRSVSVSSDGVNWVRLEAIVVDWSNLFKPLNTRWEYVRYRYDLDELGLPYGPNFQIRFASQGGGLVLDDVRVATNWDIFAPKVADQTPKGEVAGPVSELTIVFDEPIDPRTFQASDISVRNPAGGWSMLGLGDPEPAEDRMTYRIRLPGEQKIAGLYGISVGPDIRDIAGNPMDTAYQGAFEIGPVVPQPIPYSEGFESAGLSSLEGWRFDVNDYGSWSVFAKPPDSPFPPFPSLGALSIAARTGRCCLVAKSTPSHSPLAMTTTSICEAVLKLRIDDRPEAKELFLDFWLRSHDGSVTASVSGDGSHWTLIPMGSDLQSATTSAYDAFHFNVSKTLADAGATLGEYVYVKLLCTIEQSIFSERGVLFDDLSVDWL